MKIIPSNRQRGATLLTAIMILLILTVLALSVAQVTGLQERMAGIYRADQQAFQAAEEGVRVVEFSTRSGPSVCFSPYDGDFKASVASSSTGSLLENLSRPASDGKKITSLLGSSSVGVGSIGGDTSCLFFRVTSTREDDAANPTAESTMQTLFVL